jgi:hypothetical protein
MNLIDGSAIFSELITSSHGGHQYGSSQHPASPTTVTRAFLSGFTPTIRSNPLALTKLAQFWASADEFEVVDVPGD